MLSRNTPVALIVGVAGFLGSHLAEKLLVKGIQVVGIDNFILGRKENLERNSKDKNFHLLNQDASSKIDLNLHRLDYAFFIISENIPEYIYRAAFDNFLKSCSVENFNPKIILISDIDLYDNQKEGLENLRYAEKGLAGFALENKANARVVRLSAVFGPRMHFRSNDPIFRLIQAAALDKLQKEGTPLDFTTRSLYVSDAIDLLVKAFMHGATAQKIYDGALVNPIKVSEVKEVLLDPVWYESKGFIPTQLPPWPTPNLLKTEKELAWKPNTQVVTALKETIHFFKENPSFVEEAEQPEKVIPVMKKEIIVEEESKQEIKKNDEGKNREVGHDFKGYFLAALVLMLVSYALIYPSLKVAWAAFEIKNHLEKSILAVEVGDFTQAGNHAGQAKIGSDKVLQAFGPVMAITDAGILGTRIQAGKEIVTAAAETVAAISFWTQGIKALEDSVQIISGAKDGDLEKTITEANFNLDQADKRLQLVEGELSRQTNLNLIPKQFKGGFEALQKKIKQYLQGVGESRKVATILSQIVPIEGSRSYLLILVDNNTLRPGGGLVKALARVDFENGKLISIQTESIVDLEKNFKENISYPSDLKEDFVEDKLSLRDIGFEADFPTNGKLLQWVYNKAKGKQVAGVISLDFQALSKLLEAEDGVVVGEKKENITGKNFTELNLSKKNSQFESEVFKGLLNKVFFLSKQNWTKLGRGLGQSLSEKHMLVFALDPSLFSYLNSSGWAGTIPRQMVEEKGERKEFLALSETNIGSKGVNQYLQRIIELQSSVDQNGKVTHKLEVNFANQNPTMNYQSRVKVYLPAGTRLTKTLWGGSNLKGVTSFTDYGRSGYSLVISLQSKETKSLSLEYEDLKPLVFDGEQVKYSLDVVKQPGTAEDKFNFKLRYPSSFKVVSKAGEQNIPQEVSFSTTLAQDRTFEILFEK